MHFHTEQSLVFNTESPLWPNGCRPLQNAMFDLLVIIPIGNQLLFQSITLVNSSCKAKTSHHVTYHNMIQLYCFFTTILNTYGLLYRRGILKKLRVYHNSQRQKFCQLSFLSAKESVSVSCFSDIRINQAP